MPFYTLDNGHSSKTIHLTSLNMLIRAFFGDCFRNDNSEKKFYFFFKKVLF